jgi:hypothetical protein
MHSIADKAEIGIDFPDKFYSGGFGRDCSFEAAAEDDGVVIRLVKAVDQKRAVTIHLHHFLLAGVLEDLAASLCAREPLDAVHREPLLGAVQALASALQRKPAPPLPGQADYRIPPFRRA